MAPGPAAHAAPGDEGDELRTIIVSKFPRDAAQREIENVCRFMEGFCEAKVDLRKPCVFVRFCSAQSAAAAIQKLEGQPLDLRQPEVGLRADMAKSNMRSKAGAPGQDWQLPRMAHGTAYAPPPPPPPMAHAASFTVTSKRPREAEAPGAVDTLTCTSAASQGLDTATLEEILSRLIGFVAFKATPKGQCFVKFAYPHLADEAIRAAAAQGLTMSWARTSMSLPGTAAQTAAHGWEQPPQLYGAGHGGWYDAAAAQGGRAHAADSYPAFAEASPYAAKRPRIPERPDQVDTVAHLRADDRGMDAAAVEGHVSVLPGFLCFKANAFNSGGFSKWASPELAAQAAEALEARGVPAEIAKSSMASL